MKLLGLLLRNVTLVHFFGVISCVLFVRKFKKKNTFTVGRTCIGLIMPHANL